jgi:hypothetical protein
MARVNMAANFVDGIDDPPPIGRPSPIPAQGRRSGPTPSEGSIRTGRCMHSISRDQFIIGEINPVTLADVEICATAGSSAIGNFPSIVP